MKIFIFLRIITLLILLPTFFILPVYSETIIFESGKKVEAKIVNEGYDSVTVLDKKGYIFTYKKEDIQEIIGEEVEDSLPEAMNLEPIEQIKQEKTASKEDVYKRAEELFQKTMKQYETMIKKSAQ